MLRTHTCGELREEHNGATVTLCGWIDTIRTHGNVTFVDVRDRYGITQLVFKEELDLRKESVISATGTVAVKPTPNDELATGAIEVQVDDWELYSEAKPLPLDENATEDTRLKYRYLDLRRPQRQEILALRSKATQIARTFLAEQDFVEVETPILGKSTPEGARDFLVPSRKEPGSFYALPQSPQLFKQLTMIAGLDRYYQIARCFRDEDSRKDRQPEFTQIDVEMSFVEQEDVIALNEALAKELFAQLLGEEFPEDFARITYAEAMRRFGTDRPDTRFGLELTDVTEIAHETEFRVFTGAQHVVALHVKHDFSRKEIDALTDVAQTYHAKGLAWTTYDGQALDGGVAKFLEPITQELTDALGLKAGETLFFVADDKRVAQTALGAVRTQLGADLSLYDHEHYEFLWVTDFPMFERDDEQERYVSMHHPFTMPDVSEAADLSGDVERINSKSYDLVLNGSEVAGGSIRIHDQAIQKRVFELLGISEEEAQERFGFFVEALQYGTPPHGGIAWGLDRLISIVTASASIRDVIAFPKNKHAQDLMLDAPSGVDEEQLDELGVTLRLEK